MMAPSYRVALVASRWYLARRFRLRVGRALVLSYWLQHVEKAANVYHALFPNTADTLRLGMDCLGRGGHHASCQRQERPGFDRCFQVPNIPVSYTHLTLPT